MSRIYKVACKKILASGEEKIYYYERKVPENTKVGAGRPKKIRSLDEIMAIKKSLAEVGWTKTMKAFKIGAPNLREIRDLVI